MVKLKIIKINNFLYELETPNLEKIELDLEFTDIEEEPKVGDFIVMADELLNNKYEGYSTSYTFGKLNNKYGKKNIKINDVDIIKIQNKKNEIYLKRLYG